MIKVENGMVSMKGNPPLIMIDICTVTKGLYLELVDKVGFSESDAKRFIRESIEVVFMDDDEVAKDEEKAAKNITKTKNDVNKLLKLLNELGEILNEEGEEEDDD